MTRLLEIQALNVALDGRPVLRNLNLSLDTGSYGVVLGTSGVGKSTLLRTIAGLIPATGLIRIGGVDVCNGRQLTDPARRGVGFVFQSLGLWSHLNVEAHLRFVLGKSLPGAERDRRTAETLDAVGLLALRDRRPDALSGGEKQRLALARALATRPPLLLLDEPTSSVDLLRRREVRELLANTAQRFGTSMLHVTHDQEEALELGDRVFVMSDGEIAQVGTAAEIYARPTSVGVARFVGESAIVPATVVDATTADSPIGRVAITETTRRGPVWLLARPEWLGLAAEGEGVPGRIRRRSFRGATERVELVVGEDVFILFEPKARIPDAVVRLAVRRPLWVISERRPA